MTEPRIAGALPVSRVLLDDMRYAELVVTIGVHADRPGEASIGVHRVEHARICLLDCVAYLREVADRLEADHGTGTCGGAG